MKFLFVEVITEPPLTKREERHIQFAIIAGWFMVLSAAGLVVYNLIR